MITLSMVMVSCSGGNTEGTEVLNDSTLVDSTVINTDTTSVDTVN